MTTIIGLVLYLVVGVLVSAATLCVLDVGPEDSDWKGLVFLTTTLWPGCVCLGAMVVIFWLLSKLAVLVPRRLSPFTLVGWMVTHCQQFKARRGW